MTFKHPVARLVINIICIVLAVSLGGILGAATYGLINPPDPIFVPIISPTPSPSPSPTPSPEPTGCCNTRTTVAEPTPTQYVIAVDTAGFAINSLPPGSTTTDFGSKLFVETILGISSLLWKLQ